LDFFDSALDRIVVQYVAIMAEKLAGISPCSLAFLSFKKFRDLLVYNFPSACVVLVLIKFVLFVQYRDAFELLRLILRNDKNVPFKCVQIYSRFWSDFVLGV